MNQDQKAALVMTAKELWDELKFFVIIAAFFLYFILLILFTPFMLVVSAGAIASGIVWGLRLMYLSNLAEVQRQRYHQERQAKHDRFLAEHNLAYVNKGASNGKS